MRTPIEATGASTLSASETEVKAEGKFPLAKAINYSVANFGSSVFYGLFNFAMPLYLGTYNLPPSLIGLLANERSFVGALVQPVVGRISDRTRTPLGRRRPFFLVGIPLVCLGLLFLATHPDLWAMIAVVAVLAFFLAVAWDPYMALMADLFTPSQRGRVGGLAGLGVGLGNIVFILLALQFWERNEFLVFLIVIGLLLVTWGYTFLTVKEPPIDPEHDLPRKKMARPDPLKYARELLEYPEAAKYTLAITFFWLGTGGVVPFITLFGVRVLGATEAESFLLPLAATIATAIMAVPMGMIADRTSKKAVMSVGMLVFGVIAILGSQAQNMTQGSIVMLLAGMANAAMTLITPMLIDVVPRKRTAEFVGLGSAAFSFAQPVGSVLAGAVVGLATIFVGGDDAYRWAFISAGVMLLTGGLLLRTVHPERAVYEE